MINNVIKDKIRLWKEWKAAGGRQSQKFMLLRNKLRKRNSPIFWEEMMKDMRFLRSQSKWQEQIRRELERNASEMIMVT